MGAWRRSGWLLGAIVAAAAVGAAPATAAPWTTGTPHGLLTSVVVTDQGSPGNVYLLGNGGALYASGDRGLHWARRFLPAGPQGARVLAAYRGPPSLLVAIADAGDVFRSTDQGRTWTRTGCCATTIDPGDPARLLGRDADAALARSSDGGATWQPITPLTGPLTSDPAFTFDGARVWASSFTGAVSFSDDFGTTWQVAIGIPSGGIAATPGVPGNLWVGNLHSTDGGAHWLHAGPTDDPSCFTEPSPVDGDPLVTWALSCGAVQRTTDGAATWGELAGTFGWPIALGVLDAGASAIVTGSDGPWLVEPGQPPRYRGEGLPGASLFGLAADPLIPGRAYTGTFTTADGGRTWSVRADGTSAIARVGGRVLSGFFATTSEPVGGGAATQITDDLTALIGEPRGRRAWLLTREQLLTTTDGVHFTALPARGLPPRPNFVFKDEFIDIGVAAAGGRGRTVAINSDDRAHLSVSNDGGRTFHTAGPRLGLFPFVIDAVDGRLMLGVDGNQRLNRSRDGGRTFRAIRGKVVAVTVDPRRRGVWYAARVRRLYMTRDAGRTWQRMTDPPGGRIKALAAGAGRLWALTDSGVASQPLPRVAP